MTDTPCFVPASPGYWALEAIRPNGSGPDYEVIRIPVVGWEMRSSPERGRVLRRSDLDRRCRLPRRFPCSRTRRACAVRWSGGFRQRARMA